MEVNAILQQTFIELADRCATSNQRFHEPWQEIVTHYHNLVHLNTMLEALLPVRNLLSNRDAVLFALYYHDILKPANKNPLPAARGLYYSVSSIF